MTFNYETKGGQNVKLTTKLILEIRNISMNVYLSSVILSCSVSYNYDFTIRESYTYSCLIFLECQVTLNQIHEIRVSSISNQYNRVRRKVCNMYLIINQFRK